VKAIPASCLAANGGGHVPPPPPTAVLTALRRGEAGDDDLCFIATAAYGSALHPHVKILRAFRDTYLLTHDVGRRFVALYYRQSPPIAKCISEHAILKRAAQLIILPMIAFSALMLYTGAQGKLLLLLALVVGTTSCFWIRSKRRSVTTAGCCT